MGRASPVETSEYLVGVMYSVFTSQRWQVVPGPEMSRMGSKKAAAVVVFTDKSTTSRCGSRFRIVWLLIARQSHQLSAEKSIAVVVARRPCPPWADDPLISSQDRAPGGRGVLGCWPSQLVQGDFSHCCRPSCGLERRIRSTYIAGLLYHESTTCSVVLGCETKTKLTKVWCMNLVAR